MTSDKKIHRALRSALTDQTLIRIRRAPAHSDEERGYVVAIGERWMVLSEVQDGYFDGYLAFPSADVLSVSIDGTFAGRHVRQLPDWPPRSPVSEDALTSVDETVRAMAEVGGLIGVQQEGKRWGIWIGSPEEITAKWLWLDEVRPDASWKGPLGYKMKKITSVQIGTRYLTALAAVAGVAPNRQTPAPEQSVP